MIRNAAACRWSRPLRFRAMTDAVTGLGLRQSELFAMSVENTDWLQRAVHGQSSGQAHRRQVALRAAEGWHGAHGAP